MSPLDQSRLVLELHRLIDAESTAIKESNLPALQNLQAHKVSIFDRFTGSIKDFLTEETQEELKVLSKKQKQNELAVQSQLDSLQESIHRKRFEKNTISQFANAYKS